MSDPRAAELRKAKNLIDALSLVKKGLQKVGWAIRKLDDNVYVIGKPMMAEYVAELIAEINNPAPTPASSELVKGDE